MFSSVSTHGITDNFIPLLGLHFSCLPSIMPTIQYPPKLRGWTPQLRDYISCTDTVSVMPTHGADCIQGRIMAIETSASNIAENEAKHPFIHDDGHSNSDCYFKLNLYLTKRDRVELINWPPTTAAELHGSISRAAPTNLYVWISSRQVQDLAFFMHPNDFISQTYGDLTGRGNYYCVDFTVSIGLTANTRGTPATFSFEPIDHLQYDAFGYKPSIDLPSSLCERTNEAHYQLQKELSAMLTNNSTITTTKHRRFPFPFDFFKYLWKCLEADGGASVLKMGTKTAKLKQCLTKPYLVLSSAVVPTRQYWIMAQNVDAFNALRKYFSNCGVGLKKKHPRISDIGSNFGRNHLTVSEHDTINIVVYWRI